VPESELGGVQAGAGAASAIGAGAGFGAAAALFGLLTAFFAAFLAGFFAAFLAVFFFAAAFNVFFLRAGAAFFFFPDFIFALDFFAMIDLPIAATDPNTPAPPQRDHSARP
jgi:hypothetical protein